MINSKLVFLLGQHPSPSAKSPKAFCVQEVLFEDRWSDLLVKVSTGLRLERVMKGSGKAPERKSLLTMVQPSWGPRSLKYMVAVVPTGRLCSTSSSLRAFASGAQHKEEHPKNTLETNPKCNVVESNLIYSTQM